MHEIYDINARRVIAMASFLNAPSVFRLVPNPLFASIHGYPRRYDQKMEDLALVNHGPKYELQRTQRALVDFLKLDCLRLD